MTVTATETTASRSDQLNETVREIAEGDHCELPLLPEVAAQLLRLTSSLDCGVTEIVTLIKRDQSLTSHLLKMANSLRYSTGVTVSSVQQAVARLGLICVREIVILISCQCRIFDVPGFEKDVRESFRRSLAAAAFCQEIARIRRLNVEEAFLSGLLHDVGRPIMLQMLSDRRKAGKLEMTDEGLLEAASKQRVTVSARLILLWELSVRVSEVIRFQESPLEAPSCSQLASVLNLATRLSELALGPGRAIQPTDLPEEIVTALNLYPEQLQLVFAKRDKIVEWVNATI